MSRYMRVLLAILAVLSMPARAAADRSDEIVILIGLDGFRWDIPDRFDTPNIDGLIRNGARAEMVPVWPSLTYPNFWSLATGLYPEHSGIIANAMFDPALDEAFNSRSFKDSHWWLGEPIWATLERQGGKAAVLSWPGSEASNDAARPSYGMSYSPFYEELSLDQRVDAVLALAALPSGRRPRLLTIYTPLVDDAEHGHGIESPEARTAISAVDRMIGRLTAGLKAKGLDATTNIVIVADHGHMDVPTGHIVTVDNLIDLARIDQVALGSGPTMAIWPKPGYVPSFIANPRLLPSYVRIVARGALPERFHQNGSSRQAPFTLIADPGYVLCTREDRRCNGVQGMHGYDNALPQMHALFVASGPAIRRDVSLGTIENVGLYSLLAHLLGVLPAPTDGTLRPFCAALTQRSETCAAK